MVTNKKICLFCKKAYFKGKTVNQKQFDKSKCCSKKCSFSFIRQKNRSVTHRKCRGCKRTLPVERLVKSGDRPPATLCKECWRVQDKILYPRIRLNTYKKSNNKKPNTQKTKTRNATRRLIASGRLKRKSCEKCGSYGQAHHEDYSDPYNVRWLCVKHHREEHTAKLPKAVLQYAKALKGAEVEKIMKAE